ncbi:MAG: CPBP family intramembrane glutamic endopeptidase [Myxococcota bacterium]
MKDRGIVIDWALTFVAVALMAVLLALDASRPPDPTVADLAVAREVELPFKLVDAGNAVPAEMREAIGLGPDTTEDVARAVSELEQAIERQPAQPSMLLIAAAVAASEGADELCLRALDRVAEDERGMQTWRVLVDNLHDLARGRPARQPEPTLSELRNAGASDWLVERLRARHEHNSDAPTRRAEAMTRVESRATAFAERAVTSLIIVGTLFVFGSLLLLLWPLVSRSLIGSGRVGLGDLPSPFVVPATRRVVAIWFLGFLAIGFGMDLVFSFPERPPLAMALNLVLQTVVAGGLTLSLVQNFARRPGDTTPLWVPLRLGALIPAGGPLGVLVWTVAGLSMSVVVVSAASIVQAGFGAAAEEAQPILRLFAEGEDVRVQVAIAVAAVLIGPFFEEVLFRGFIYRNLRDLMGPGLAMGASALLFGLVHLQAPLIVPLAALGVVLAFLFERSGSLLVPIAVHSLWNLGQLIIAHQVVTG